MQLGIQDIWESIQQLPQTQKDIRTIAQATKTVQSPQVQKQIVTVQNELQDLGKTMVVIMAVGAAASAGMFMLQLWEVTKK